MTEHSCEKCINTDVGWGDGGEDRWEGVLGKNGWLSRCVSPAEPAALRVVTQFLLSLSVMDYYRLGRACRAHSTAVLLSQTRTDTTTTGLIRMFKFPNLHVGRNFTPPLSYLLTLSGGCDIS